MTNRVFAIALVTNGKSRIVAIAFLRRDVPEFALKPSKILLQNYGVVIMAWWVAYVPHVHSILPRSHTPVCTCTGALVTVRNATRNLVHDKVVATKRALAKL